MKKLGLILITGLVCLNAVAADAELIANNKESESRVLTILNKYRLKKWRKHNQADIYQEAKLIFSNTLTTFEKRDSYCDIGFSRLLMDEAKKASLISEDNEFIPFLSYLRSKDIIDDILMKNIILSNSLDKDLKKSKDNKSIIIPPIDAENKKTEELNLKDLYANINTPSDEISSCSLGKFYSLAMNLKWKKKGQRDRLLHQTNYLAYKNEIISRETFNQVEVIRKSGMIDWNVFIGGYLDIINNAKDKLSPTGKPEKDPAKYSTKYADRKAKLTNREKLYKNFDSTQIMILSDIIHKTSKRMEAHYVAINFQYENKPDSEVETYVLSPMERYRLSIKMLRKDMGEVMRSDTFANKAIDYEDLVSAAYETGLIKSEELELILKFEDFWNPKDPKWKIYSNFAFSILGTAAFFLPPPWNIVGAIALVVTQTQVNKKQKKANPDDNWNVVI